MATLYYGNGNCSIEDSESVRGIQIKYRGNIKINDKTSSSFSIGHKNNIILVFPISEGTLKNLFDYEGEFKILSAIVADVNAEIIPTTIKKVMDFAELLGKAEDITTNSENLSRSSISGKIQEKTALKHKIIPNLHTSTQNIDLYYKSGENYSGDFHIHIENNNIMTGKEHSKDAEDLYYKSGEELKPTKNSRINSKGTKISRTTTSGGY